MNAGALLDERNWILGGGLTPEWELVRRERIKRSLDHLKGVASALKAKAPRARVAPRALLAKGYLRGLDCFLDRAGPARDRIACEPLFDYWLFSSSILLARPPGEGRPPGEERWDSHLGAFSGFAAWLVLSERGRASLKASLDCDARFFFYGSPFYVEFPKDLAGKPVALAVNGDRVVLEGGQAAFTLGQLQALGDNGRALGAGAMLRRLPEPTPGIVIDDESRLCSKGMTTLAPARLAWPAKRRFLKVIRAALADVEQADPVLYAEMTDLLRVLVPLAPRAAFSSVSSSYSNMRGAIGLSHCDDPLLQAETMIHEFCHQKLNLLNVLEPILEPGQSGRVFYSPWRDDARRLRGLLYGAHAFLNVARYYASALSRREHPPDRRFALQGDIARRLYQIENALNSLAFYASFTEFGRRFFLGMWREAGMLSHLRQGFPAHLLRDLKRTCDAHERRFALPGTGYHKGGRSADADLEP